MAIEHNKKLIDDQEEMLKKMGAVLDDTFSKLMARDQDVDREFLSMERRLYRHRVALDIMAVTFSCPLSVTTKDYFFHF